VNPLCVLKFSLCLCCEFWIRSDHLRGTEDTGGFTENSRYDMRHCMSKQKILTLFVMLGLALVMQEVTASAQRAPRLPFDLQLGMNEESAHQQLKKIASQQKEERDEEEGGEQEVWILNSDAKFSYVIAKFSREHVLILITAVARPQQVRYADLASLNTAARASDGQNYSYKWKVEPGKHARAYVINARGSNPEFLTSYSVYYVR